ncbi:MAG TPA: hypothetical protein VNF75_01870 [Candidatus Dormibacteraeota bacterium]|nr:hypothetical protein [Candidatus Dormibacteraeota bacterium]
MAEATEALPQGAGGPTQAEMRIRPHRQSRSGHRDLGLGVYHECAVGRHRDRVALDFSQCRMGVGEGSQPGDEVHGGSHIHLRVAAESGQQRKGGELLQHL